MCFTYHSFKKYLSIYVYAYVCFACVYTCASHACRAHGGQERVLDPLELESYKAVSHGVKCWDSNPGLLRKQPVLLSAEPALQS